MLFLLIPFLAAALPALASEQDALNISIDIQAMHLPYGTILDPVIASGTVVSYTRAGDSATWTGHYLAAEAFRYRVTHSPEALNNVRAALAGLRSLVDVTGTGLLARCLLPADSPYAPAILQEEQHNGIHTGSIGNNPYFWIGNTSRDQYSGVFFGLGAAYDMVGDAGVRADIAGLVTRLLNFLLDKHWLVEMPDRAISTTFIGRADQQLSFLQVGRHVNARQFASVYKSYRLRYAAAAIAPIALEVLDDSDSYFKFNIDAINLFNLLRLEDSSFFRFFYRQAYDVFRRTTDGHGNAHFNMIDRALNGPDDRRDAETRALLDEWLTRPRDDEWVDWRGRYPACGEDRACEPLPVEDRVRTDFLWQRSPFLLYGGGAGNIEGAGIDYILPYWMARYYAVLSD